MNTKLWNSQFFSKSKRITPRGFSFPSQGRYRKGLATECLSFLLDLEKSCFGRSRTFRCLPTAAPYYAPSELGAYLIRWHLNPSFSVFIIAHLVRNVKGFCEKS